MALDFATEDLLSGIVVEFDEKRKSVGLNEFLEFGFVVRFAIVNDFAFVELKKKKIPSFTL